MAEELPKPEELIDIQHRPPRSDWMATPTNIRKGMYCYASNPKSVEYVGLPNAREWYPTEEDWKLPENSVHGHLCSMRRMRGQMPLFYRNR
jgi:hypothetical protein